MTVVARTRRTSLALPTARQALAGAAQVAAVGLLMAWMLHAHQRDLGAPLWIDEGISLGIAAHPLSAIPDVLRQDGSPPLYYLLLHVWTGAFGTSVRSGHAFSLVLAMLAVPAAAWAARGVFGAYAGLAAAAIVALDPFTAVYAVELRMYTLLLLVSILATGAFLRAFVVHRGHLGWAAAFAVALAAVCYTHNWGFFFGAAAAATWVVLVVAGGGGRRRLILAGLVGFGGAALLIAPWLPVLAEQAAHTGAPWSHPPRGHSIARAFQRVLGGKLPETVLLVIAAGGLLEAIRRRRADPVDLRAMLATLALAVGTFAIAYAWSNIASPAWALRYLAIVLGPLAIVVAAGLVRTGPLAVVALAVVFIVSWYGSPSHSSLARKSNVGIVADRLGPHLRPGTLVFSTQPEQVPVLKYYLPPGMRYATPLGAVADPGVTDWRDAMARLDRARIGTSLRGDLRRLRPGERLLLVQPHFGHTSAPWTQRIRVLARQAIHLVRRDRDIRIVRRVVPRHGYSRSTVAGLLLEKRSAGGHRAARRG